MNYFAKKANTIKLEYAEPVQQWIYEYLMQHGIEADIKLSYATNIAPNLSIFGFLEFLFDFYILKQTHSATITISVWTDHHYTMYNTIGYYSLRKIQNNNYLWNCRDHNNQGYLKTLQTFVAEIQPAVAKYYQKHYHLERAYLKRTDYQLYVEKYLT